MIEADHLELGAGAPDADTPDPRVGDPHVQRYLAGWLCAGLAVSVLFLLAVDGPVTAPSGLLGWGQLLGFAAVIAAGYLSQVAVPIGRSVESINLIEAALVAVLVVFPGPLAFTVSVAGIAAANLLARVTPVKAGFNVSTSAVGMAGAVLIRDAVAGPAAPLSTRGLLALALALAFFGAVTFLAVSGVVARLERKPLGQIVHRGRHVVFSTISNTAIGIIGAVIWQHRPELVFLLAVPIAATTFAFRGRSLTLSLVEQMRRERDRLDQIIRGASDGISLVDEAGRVVVFNDSLARMTGIASTEAVGAPLRSVLPLRDAGEHRPVDAAAIVAAAVPGRPPVEVDAELLDPETGDVRSVRVTATAVETGDGHVGGVLLVRDTSREREVERLKDDFLMRVSHELRTPLTPIKGYAESLRLHLDRITPELLETSLQRISERSDHMTALIDDLLLVASMQRPTALSSDPNLTALDPTEAVRRAVAALRARHDDHHVTVIEATTATCVADPARLDRILAVLLENAVTYSPVGTRIEVLVRAADDGIAIDVIDEGRGVPRSHLTRIFERFHRVEDPLVMTTGGLGIGLHLARHLARSMGGEVSVTSVLGQGSTFTLVLRRADVDAPRAPTSPLRRRR